MNKKYNIGCSTDKNYAQHLGVMIFSLLSNTSCPELFHFHIMDGGILPVDIQRFKLIEERFKCKLSFLKPDRKYFDKLKVTEYTEATYYRYFLMDTTTEEKMLFLDSDMVVEGDVTELYELNPEGSILSAVTEVLYPIEHLEKLKLEKSFNAGMLLVDCKKWQEEQVSQKAYNCQIENESIIKYADQDSLNMVLKGKWHAVPYKWNVIARLKLTLYGLGKADYRFISKEELFENYNNPKIIHYANRLFKPWFWLDPTPYKKNYVKYKNLSPWKDVPFPDKSFSGFFKRINFYFSFVIRYFKNNKKN